MLEFVVERLDRRVVELRGLTECLELNVSVGHGKKGLLHRRVEHAALAQRQPRHQRPLEFAHGGIGPADAEQCLAGVRTLETHSLQNGFRLRGALTLQQHETEREIRLVFQGQQLLAAGVYLADPVEVGNRFLQPASADQCHAQIELCVRGPVRRALPIAQRGNGVVVASLAHHELREQHVAFRVDARIHLVRYLAQRPLGLFQIAALVPNLAQIKPGAVAHELGSVLLEQRLENSARLDVLAEGQVQASEQQLRFFLGVRNPPQLPRSQQAGDRVEVVVLKEIEQHIAVGQVLYLMRRQPVGIRLDVFCLRNGSRQQQSAEEERPQSVDHALHIIPSL